MGFTINNHLIKRKNAGLQTYYECVHCGLSAPTKPIIEVQAKQVPCTTPYSQL